jgi:hypothetical protein
MANIVSDTQWHGNPRPITSYVTTVYDTSVASPYYADGRNVPVHETYNTPVPLVDLLPKATVLVPGPAPLVEVQIDGLWPDFSGVDVNITRTNGVNGDYIDTLFHTGETVGPVFTAEALAAIINEEDDLTATSDGQKIIISALAPVTSLTIVTFAAV